MSCKYPVFNILLLLLTFGGYGCEKKQVKIVSAAESTSDSTYHQIQSNLTSDSITIDSTSPIFMTFFSGMSLKQFQVESERLVSEGLLTQSANEIIFEPVEGAKFRLCHNFCEINFGLAEEFVDNQLDLDFIELYCDPISDKLQKKLFSVYRDKYGGLFNSKSESNLSSEHSGKEVYAIKVLVNEYSWHLSDGREIELSLITNTRIYKSRHTDVYAEIDLITGRFNENAWIKIPPKEVRRIAIINYFSKRFVKRKKLEDQRMKIEKDEAESKQDKRIKNNRNNI